MTDISEADGTVGFIGLGNIGKPMALNLLTSDAAVHVYDVARAPMDELAAAGAVAAESVAALGRACQIVGLCVRDDNDVEQLIYGPQGLLSAMAKGSVIAVHSTVTQASVRKWAADAAEYGIHLIDAPITGGAAHG